MKAIFSKKFVSILILVLAVTTMSGVVCTLHGLSVTITYADEEDIEAETELIEDESESIEEPISIAATSTKQLEGSGTSTSPYLIYDEDDLNDIRNYTFYDNGARSTTIPYYFSLMSSIVLENAFTPIEYIFKGVFEGNNYTITNLTFDINDEGKYGLFYCNKGTIQNVYIAVFSVDVTCDNDDVIFVGSLAGTNYGTITKCYISNSTIDLTNRYNSYMGGFVGASYDGVISNCRTYSTDTFISSGIVGGIVGYMYSADIEQCYNYATVQYYHKIENGCAAGIVGKAVTASSISYCYNYGTIEYTGKSNLFASPQPYMAQIVGYLGKSYSYSYNYYYGTVSGKGSNYSTGGIGYIET